MKIVLRLSRPNEIWESAFRQAFQGNVRVNYRDEEPITDAEIIVTNYSMSLAEAQQYSQLKVIMFSFTGVNQLPLDYFHAKGITVVNSHAHAKFVAERAFSLALCLLGRIPELDQTFRLGWESVKDSKWTSLHHKKCGILGMGAIGQELVKLLAPFQCELITLKRYQHAGINNIRYVERLEDLCLESDILFVSLPLTNATRDMLNQDLLFKMQNKWLINVGRGEVINEQALFESLERGILYGAALDVWYQYPPSTEPGKYPFHYLKQVILSPHCAGNALESQIAIIADLVSNLTDYLSQGTLRNIVNLNRKY